MGMKFQTLGDKPPRAVVDVKSDETTVTIKKGGSCFLKLDGTEDGFAVVSSESFAIAKHMTFMGLALADIAPGAMGEAIVFGFYQYARWRYTTRAASTDVWASYSAGAIGDVAGWVSLAGDQAVSRSVAAADTMFTPAIILAETYASQTTQASDVSATNDSRTASTGYLKVLVRAM